MNPEDALFDLINQAQETQAAAERAVAGLAKEREALAEERQALARDRAALLDAIRSGAKEGVSGAAREALKGASESLTENLKWAQRPLLDNLKDAAADATRAAGKLKRVASWLSLPYVGCAAALLGVLIAGAWLAGWFENRHEREQLLPFEQRRDELLQQTAS